MIYHVSKKGSRKASGTDKDPFLTIQQAADILQPGDSVIVHEGVYREWVKPNHGGISENRRITYMAAEGEHVEITGAEQIDDWQHVEGTVYKTTIPNDRFGSYNPYNTRIYGDWWCGPFDHDVHTGEVYLNGKSIYEAVSKDEVINPVMRKEYIYDPNCVGMPLFHPEDTIYQWFAEVDDDNTTIYVNFQNLQPETTTVTINVRPCVFYPEKTGLDYITVKGFELTCAATWYAPPTGDRTHRTTLGEKMDH